MADKRFASDDGCFMSTDCTDIYVDGPTDTTIRPVQADRREYLQREYERIQAALAAGVDLSEQQINVSDEEYETRS